MEFIHWNFWILLMCCYRACTALNCGYPGSPLHGRPSKVKDNYEVGETVTYTCESSYYLLGSAIRRCQSNGVWSGRLPLCDIKLSSPGIAEVSQSLSEYPPSLAIDGNVDSCSITTRRAPRWWRLDLGRSYTILSVGVTIKTHSTEQSFAVFILGLSGNSAVYQRCASYSGKFASPSLILVCGEGSGLVGRYIHIEDNRKDLLYFSLCEVEVMVVKDRYDCGQPERPTQSYTVRLKPEQVEYRCLGGYKLQGNRKRQCLMNGQWSETQPLCIEVKCNNFSNPSNGNVKIVKLTVGAQLNEPIFGSVAKYMCDEGYILLGNDTRECSENGDWSGEEPICKVISCELPSFPSKISIFKLLNSSTEYGSIVELSCSEGYQVVGVSPLIRCRSDGVWSKIKAKCSPLGAVESAIENNDVDISASEISIGLVVGITGAVIISTVVLIYFVLRRRKSEKVDRRGISSTIDNGTNPTSSSGTGSSQSLVASAGLAFHLKNYEGFYSEPKSRPVPICLISNGHYDYPRKNCVGGPNYSFSIISNTLENRNEAYLEHSSGSISSKENIYEEINIRSRNKSLSVGCNGIEGSSDKGLVDTKSKINIKTEQKPIVALYALVDFKKKREERLKKERVAPDGASYNSPNNSVESSPENVSIARNHSLYSVTLRELPPIPVDSPKESVINSPKGSDVQTTGNSTNLMSQTSNMGSDNRNNFFIKAVPYKKSEVVMIDNVLYSGI